MVILMEHRHVISAQRRVVASRTDTSSLCSEV